MSDDEQYPKSTKNTLSMVMVWLHHLRILGLTQSSEDNAEQNDVASYHGHGFVQMSTMLYLEEIDDNSGDDLECEPCLKMTSGHQIWKSCVFFGKLWTVLLGNLTFLNASKNN